MSRTALGVGILRASHRLVDAEPWIVDDPPSEALFGDLVRALLASDLEWHRDDERDALRGHVLVRGVFAEARLERAIARGVRQYAILGAGFDTFAYRQPRWMRDVRVFEVDAPQTQRDKRERLARAGIVEPANLTFVPVDFERTSLAECLSDAGFDRDAPAFFSWLGVTMYLTRAAIDGVFRFVVSLPQETEIAFTFMESSERDASTLARRVAATGEPFVTRFEAAGIEPMLRSFGFRDVTVVSLVATRALLGERNDRLCVPSRRSLASAIV